MGKNSTVNVLKSFKKKVNADFPIERCIFFGSRTRGKHHKWSDIDLVLVSAKFTGMEFRERAAKMYDYWDLDYPVDFLCYTPKEFNKLRNMVSIAREAVMHGVEV